MKRMIAGMLLLAVMLMPLGALGAGSEDETAIKQVMEQYFALRYKILSNLNMDPDFLALLDPDIQKSKDALDEGDVLESIVLYRKAQINDLRLERLRYDLVYSNIQVEGKTAKLLLSENYEVYYKCARTVKNSGTVVHNILLKKNGTRWQVVSDDYVDPEGVRKQLITYFVDQHLTLEEARKKLMSETGNQLTARIQRLDEILAKPGYQNVDVFQIGKPLAFLNGAAVKIDAAGTTPVLTDGKAMLPLRFMTENLGGTVTWEGKSKAVSLEIEGHRIQFKIGEKAVSVDGIRIPTDIPGRLVNGKTMIPAEMAAIAFEKSLYTDETGLVILHESSLDIKADKALLTQLQDYFGVLLTKSDFPRIDGSTATYPLSMEMGKVLLGLDETGVKGFITHNTTHNAYVNLIENKTDIIFVTQPSPDELAQAAEKGVQLEVVPVCREGFVFLANKENPVNSLTVEQVQDIYQGKLTNWKEVGGEDTGIIPYQREANSGSQTLMENTVMKGLKLMQPPKEVIVYGMGELIDRVADYSNAKNALGYSVYYYATRMYTSRAVKVLAIDGVEPGKQTIQDGTYPFTVGYYAVLRKDEPKDSNARKLLNWFLGDEGQRVVDKAGFVPLK